MSAQVIDFKSFKQGKYGKREQMTLQECVQELEQMANGATLRQQTALGVGIDLIIGYMRGVDDLK